MDAQLPLRDRRMLAQHRRLLERVRRSAPRLIEITAPPGYGKTTLAKGIGEALGGYAYLVAPTSDAFTNAAERHADLPSAIILDNAENIPIAEAPALASLIPRVPSHVTVIVCARGECALHRLPGLLPHERIALHRNDLALQEDETRSLLEELELDGAALEEIDALCEGWPVALLSLKSTLVGYGGGAAVARVRESLDLLFPYLDASIMKELSKPEETALCLCAALPGLPAPQAIAALGDATGIAGLQRRQLVVKDDSGGLVPLPLLDRLIRVKYRSLATDVLTAAAPALLASSEHLYASAAYYNAGDRQSAASVLRNSAVTPNDLMAFPLQALTRTPFAGLDRAALQSYPVLWVSVFADRWYREPPESLLHDAQNMLRSPTDLAPGLRSLITAIAAVLAGQSGSPQTGYGLLREATFLAAEDGGDSAFVESAFAWLDAHTGKADRGGLGWSAVRPHVVGCHAWFAEMMHIELQQAWLSAHPTAAFSLVGRMIAVAEQSGSTPAVAHALLAGVQTAWLYGDDQRLSLFQSQLGALLEKGDVPPARAIASAIAGTSLSNIAQFPLADAWAKLISAVSQQKPRAEQLLHEALAIAEATNRATLRVLTRLALARVVPDIRKEMESAAAQILMSMLPDHEREQRISAILTQLSPLLNRFEHLSASGASTRDGLFIQTACGRVLRGAQEIKLSLKSLELLMALAVETRPVPRDIVLSRLWPEQPVGAAYSALKMCVHRTRQQIGDAHAIEVENGVFRLGSAVSTDAQLLFAPGPPIGIQEQQQLLDSLLAGRPAVFSNWDWFAAFEEKFVGATRTLGISLSREALEGGEVDRALTYARALAHIDPCDEDATELLIRAHIERGERGAALAEFRRFTRSLKHELDLEPSPALRELFRPNPRSSSADASSQ